jgi:Carboxypeptidase regulatory-like domain
VKRLVLFLLVLAVGIYVHAQNLRGSITGQVTDATGAAVSHAEVTVTSTDNGAVVHGTTTSDGYYAVPNLLPGGYTLQVTAAGFKTFERPGIPVQTQQNVSINVQLEVGAATEQITVTAAPPLIDTADASTGQVLTTDQVEDLPTNGGTPLGFARIEYGTVVKAKHALGGATPMSNQTVDDFSLGGGNSSSNELLLNGVPNMQDSDRYAAFSPQLDSVDQIRVDVFGANVEYGDTSGGTVNMTTKGGTNSFHGSARWEYEDIGCSNLSGKFAGRSTNNCTWMSALPYSQKVGGSAPLDSHTNQFGGTIGGPVWIPHVFNGHNKLFFFYAYETYRGQPPASQTITSVPTDAERAGDFSALLPLTSSTKTYQLYNPYTATGTQQNFTRSPIPNNCLGPAATNYSSTDCPGNAGLTLSPIALAYLKLVPHANYTGPTTTADGENNYFTYTPTTQDYRSHMGRIDWNISSKDKMFGEAHRSRYLNSASNYFHDALSGTKADQIFVGGQIDEIHTFSPTLFSDVRGSITRTTTSSNLSSTGISPTTLGFPGYLAQNSTTLAIPYISFTDQTSPQSWSAKPGSIENYDNVDLLATVTKNYMAHTFLAGVDLRAYKGSYLTPNYANGSFSFGNSKGNPVSGSNSSNPAYFGSAFALFMLGIPTGGEEDIGAPFQYNSFLNAFFLQDDWKARPNVTVSIGIRLEHEIPVNESQNRMVNGFNPTATNAVTSAANANYAAHPSTLLPASGFNAVGGATYASAGNRYAYHVPPVYYSPRLGITWSPEFLHGKGVVRLGFGLYNNPFNDYYQGQSYGYSATTAYVATADNYMTNNTLSDPFPTSSSAAAVNPIQTPSGNTLGVNADLGAKMVYYSPVVKVPYAERTSLDVQYQVGNTILIDLGYINTHQVHLSYSNTVDAIPLLPYLSHSQYFDLATNNLMTGTIFKNGGPPTTDVTNPFKGLPGMTGGYATASVLHAYQYLQTYPQFNASSVTEQLIPGSEATYNALNARVAKLMGHGLTINGVFEWSHLLGTFNQLNPGGPLNYGENTSDYPFHFAGYGTYQIPVGRGRQFFSSDNRIVDGFIGGWQISAIYQFLSGQPMSWGNTIYTGSSWKDFRNKQHSSANVNGQAVFNTSVFDTRTCVNGGSKCQNDPTLAGFNPNNQPNSYNFRTFPAYLLRQDYTSDWDANVQKDIKGWENIDLQLRLDCFNLLNRPQYNTPNVSPTSSLFGTTTGVFGGTNSRQFQVGAHFTF